MLDQINYLVWQLLSNNKIPEKVFMNMKMYRILTRELDEENNRFSLEIVITTNNLLYVE